MAAAAALLLLLLLLSVQRKEMRRKPHLREETRANNRHHSSCPSTSTAARMVTTDCRVPELCCVLSQSLAGVHPTRAHSRNERRQRQRTMRRTWGCWEEFPEPASRLCENPISRCRTRENSSTARENLEGDGTMVRSGGHGWHQTAAICCCGELSHCPFGCPERPS